MEKLIRSMPPILKGSIGETHYKCRTRNCKCKSGSPHSAFYFSYRKAGKTHTVHVPKELVKDVQNLCKAWKEILGQAEDFTHLTISSILKNYKDKRKPKE
jgi:hypothetical protein